MDATIKQSATQGSTKSKKLDLTKYWYEWRVMAAAAGIHRSEFWKTTLTDVIIAWEGQKKRQFLITQPLINLKWSQISDESLKQGELKPKAPHPKRKEYQLRDELPYMTKGDQVKALELIKGENPPPIPYLSPEAARGIVDFVERANKNPSEASHLNAIWGRMHTFECEKPKELLEHQKWHDGVLTVRSPLRQYWRNIYSTAFETETRKLE